MVGEQDEIMVIKKIIYKMELINYTETMHMPFFSSTKQTCDMSTP
jgi:hypothetical protein